MVQAVCDRALTQPLTRGLQAGAYAPIRMFRVDFGPNDPNEHLARFTHPMHIVRCDAVMLVQTIGRSVENMRDPDPMH